jgi:hypothetical protein
MRQVLSIQEYDRRWALIMEAFRTGHFTLSEARAAVHELVRLRCSR